MNISMRSLLIYTLTILSAVMLTGCASKSFNLIQDDLPQSQTGSLLKGVHNSTFALNELSDTRGTDSTCIGLFFDSKILLNRPVASVVSDMIKKEFKRNGHSFIETTSSSSPDYIVEGSVSKYWFIFLNDYYANHRWIGTVGVELKIVSRKDNKRVYRKYYRGEFMKRGDGKIENLVVGIMDQALLSMVRDISSDQELADFIAQK
jgi:hypothetical protein